MGSWLGSDGLHLCQSQLHVGPVMDLETSLPPSLAEVARRLSGLEPEDWEWLIKIYREHGEVGLCCGGDFLMFSDLITKLC